MCYVICLIVLPNAPPSSELDDFVVEASGIDHCFISASMAYNQVPVIVRKLINQGNQGFDQNCTANDMTCKNVCHWIKSSSLFCVQD